MGHTSIQAIGMTCFASLVSCVFSVGNFQIVLKDLEAYGWSSVCFEVQYEE